MNIMKISAAIAFGVAGTHRAQAAEFTLEQGTMSLGGSAGISLEAGGGVTAFAFGANPSFGYFVSDNIQVFGSLQLEYDEAFSFGVGLGGNYVTDLAGMKYYVGVHADVMTNEDTIWVGAQTGFLFPLSEHVAMDLSVRPEYEVNRGDFSLNAGWLGVNAYF